MVVLGGRQLLLLGGAILIGATLVIASNKKDFVPRKIYGALEYTFLNEKTNYLSSDITSHIQRYLLGYENYYYNPNLLIYDISGSLYFNSSSTTLSNGDIKDFDIKKFNYRAYFDVIQGSRYPFTIYLEKNDMPILSLLSLNNYISARDVYKYGVYGSVFYKKYTMLYSAYNQSMKSKSYNYVENRDDSDFYTKIYRSMDKVYYSLDLKYRVSDYTRNSFLSQYRRAWRDVYSSVGATLRWKPSKTLNTNSYIRFYKNDRFNLKSSTLASDIFWQPSIRYSGNLGFLAQSFNYGINKSDSLSIYGTGSYKLTKNLTTTHGFTLFDISGDLYKQNSGSLKFGLTYSKSLSDTSNYYLSSNVELKAERGSYNKEYDAALDLVLNRDTILYNFGAGYTKHLRVINSSFSLNTQYNGYHSNIGEDMGTISVSSSLTTRFNQNFSFLLRGSYSRAIQTFKNELLQSDIDVDMENYIISQTINYNTMLGYNGRLNSNFGLSYSKSRASERVYAIANLGFRYKILKGMLFRSEGRVRSDLLSDSIEYRTFLGLDYIIRQTTLTSGLRYQNRIVDSDNGYGKQNIYVQLKRIF